MDPLVDSKRIFLSVPMTFGFVLLSYVGNFSQIKTKNMSELIHLKVDGCPVDIQAKEPIADAMPAIAMARLINEYMR